MACPNCEAETSVLGPYCPRCGQDNRRPRLRLRDGFADAFDALTSLDGKLVRTVVRLTLDAGGTAREYVEGRRIRYVSPMRYALGTCALWWAVMAYRLAAAEPELAALAAESAAKAREVETLRTMMKYGQVMNLVFVPLLVPAVSLAFLRGGRSYAEHLGLLLYVCGHVFLWRALFAATGALHKGLAGVLDVCDPLLLALFLGVAVYRFHRGDARFLALRSVLAVVGFFFLSGLLTVAAKPLVL